MTCAHCARESDAIETTLIGIMELLAAGAVRVREITTFVLQQAQAAHRLSESRHLRGKLVFEVR